ncbi:MAG: nucleotidyltransferase family protein [Chloroflexi bacterium]|nr:nucleotidyltransferase family protein [Chloroflexota bacterium]MBI4338463.1 nucleotidyltransferase family protein [Chloroflexota bacterium]
MRRSEILATLAHHKGDLQGFGVSSLALFGSAARDEAGPESDVDILVEFDRPVGLFEFLALKGYLEGLLGHTVDLVTPAALRPHMRDHVLQEALYAA